MPNSTTTMQTNLLSPPFPVQKPPKLREIMQVAASLIFFSLKQERDTFTDLRRGKGTGTYWRQTYWRQTYWRHFSGSDVLATKICPYRTYWRQLYGSGGLVENSCNPSFFSYKDFFGLCFSERKIFCSLPPFPFQAMYTQ